MGSSEQSSPWEYTSLKQEDLEKFKSSPDAAGIDVSLMSGTLLRNKNTGAYLNGAGTVDIDKSIKAYSAWIEKMNKRTMEYNTFLEKTKEAPGTRAQTILSEKQNPLGTFLTNPSGFGG